MLYKALTLASVLAGSFAAKVSYSNHTVIRCNAGNQKQLELLHDLEENNDMELDFWLETRILGKPVDIMVAKNRLPTLRAKLDAIGVKCSTMIETVENAMHGELRVKDDASWFESYHEWTEVYDWLDELAAAYPNLATVETIGTTYLGKPMKIIKISTDPEAKKPTLWFDGGLHAREWITVTTVSYLADTFIRGYGVDGDATSVLDAFDITIAPILNVDGYDYTRTEDRMWRKTRSPNSKSPCDGTDPNRNWEFHWGEAGTSDQGCSDSYQGAYAASEVEVQAIQNYLYDNKDVLKGYINFHAYSQLWMSPWGYTYSLPDDYQTQNDLSKAAVAAIEEVHGMVYEYGPIATTIYPASGSSADYTYGVCGIVYSYGVELRDTGTFGFLLPPEEIIPQGQEIFAAIVTMANYIEQTL